MTRVASRPPRVGLVVAALATGVVAGAAALAPLSYLVAGGLLVALALLAVRVRARSELIVAFYWLTFVFFSTMLVAYVVPGMFILFYGAMLVAIAGNSMARGLRLDVPVLWVYGGFLLVVVLSLIGSTAGMGELLDKLILFPFGALVLLQFNSERGHHWVAAGGLMASVAVAAWVIFQADQAQFAYRANLAVNQNVVSFYIGAGFVIALAWLAGVDAWQRSRRWLMLGAVLTLGVMAYSLLLLASRGAVIALLAGFAVLAIRSAFYKPGRLVLLLLVVALAAGSTLLPGGAGLAERFSGSNTATGGGRVEIWSAVGAQLGASGPGALLLGHGFDQSSVVVSRNFGTLDSTHNAYLLIAYDFGLLGLALFLALHIIPLVRAVGRPGPWSGIVIGMTIYLMTTSLFLSTPDNFLFWTGLATVLAISARLNPSPLRSVESGRRQTQQTLTPTHRIAEPLP